MNGYAAMKGLVIGALEKNIGAVIDGSEAAVFKIQVRPIRPSIFLYTSWRAMFRCTVHYRIANKHYKQEIFAKTKASQREYDCLKRIWESLPDEARSSVPRPVGFESCGKNDILLTEYVPGWNLNRLMCGACLPAISLFSQPQLRRWSSTVAQWLSRFQTNYLTVDAEMTRREIEDVRRTLKGLDLLPDWLRSRLDAYLREQADTFLQVHRATSLDLVARNLLLHHGRLVFVDFEPFGDRNIFHGGLRFCADLWTKTRYRFYPSGGFENIERSFWESFDFRGDKTKFLYAKVLFGIEHLDYLLMARREYWKNSGPQWDSYIQRMASQAEDWLGAAGRETI